MSSRSFKFSVKITLDASDDEVNNLTSLVNSEADALLNVTLLPGVTEVYDSSLIEIDPEEDDEDEESDLFEVYDNYLNSNNTFHNFDIDDDDD